MGSELNVGGITTTGNVGIGVTPVSNLTVMTTGDAADDAAQSTFALMLQKTNDTDNLEIGLGFRASTALGADKVPGGAITFERTGSKSIGSLHFKTAPSENNLDTRLTISSTGLCSFSNGINVSAGDLGVGTTNPDAGTNAPTSRSSVGKLNTYTGVTAEIANSGTLDIPLTMAKGLMAYLVESNGNSNYMSAGFFRSNNNGASSSFTLFGQSENSVAVTIPSAGNIRITNNSGVAITFFYAITVIAG